MTQEEGVAVQNVEEPEIKLPAGVEAAAVAGAEDMPDIYDIPKYILESLEAKVKSGAKGEEITPLIKKLMEPTQVVHDEVTVPVDMRGVGKNFHSISDLFSELTCVVLWTFLLEEN